jgi:hypothetical protein
MAFWLDVLSGCLGSVFAGLFFVFWYAFFQWYLGVTDVVIGYNWSWKGTSYHPNFDIRNRSKSRTYLLANIAYSKESQTAPVWVDNKSLWGIELRPGSINHFDDVAAVKNISSIEECLKVRVEVRLQTGRLFWLTGQGPGQEGRLVMGRFQRLAFRFRDFMEKKAISME